MPKKQVKSKGSKSKVKEAKHAKHSENEDEVKHAKHAENEDESETENEDEGETESEDEDGEDGDAAGDGSDGDHADAADDVKLIKKMIAEYLGKDAGGLSKDQSEAMHALGKEAYQAHQSMGKKEDEAYKCAGEAMKLAHYMHSKQSEEEAETESEDEGEDEGHQPPPKKVKKPAPKADDGDGDDDDGGSADTAESEDECGGKESKREKALKKRLLEAEGRMAALEAKAKKSEVNGYVDQKLKESKRAVSITKRFREAAAPFKSKADFDAKWKVFLEGVSNSEQDVDWDVMMEKSITTEDGSRVEGKALDFSNCAE